MDDKKTIQHNFIKYLEDNYDYARPKIMASNVFYAYNNDIGMEFWSIFKDNDNMEKAKELLEIKFIDVKRKNPKGQANVHYGCWKKFKEFLDKEYNNIIRNI